MTLKTTLLAAVAALSLTAGAASASIQDFTFTILPGSWFQIRGTGGPFGLPDNPTITGSVSIDDTKDDGSAFTALNYVTGSKTWTLEDIDIKDSSVGYYATGAISSFFIVFISPSFRNDIASSNTASISDGDRQIGCNGCVTTNIPVPAPEPMTWAIFLIGLVLLGAAMRGRRHAAALA